jgi:hypothetical protein
MVKERDKLLYELIFSEEEDFVIDVSDYVEDLRTHMEFIGGIRDILRRSKVSIINHNVNVDSNTVTWTLKVRKT